MKRYFRSLLEFRREELPQLIPLFLHYFFLILTSYILKSASSGLFLNKVGVGKLPYAYMLIAIVATIVAYLLARLSTRISITRLILATQWFLIGNMFLLWWLLRFTSWIWPYYAFLVWMKIFSILTVSQFWIFANNLFDPRQAKRLFGLLNLGGVVGAMLGGTFTLLFVRILLAENLLLCAAATMVLASGVFWQAARRAPSAAPKMGPKEPEDFHTLDMVRLAIKNRHLLVIGALISIAVIVSKLVEYQFFGIAEATYSNKEDLTAFLGGFFGLYLNAVTFTVQFFLTGMVLRRFGVGGALRFTPAAVMVGVVGVLALPGIWTASALRMVEAGCRYTLNKTSLEVLYLPIPPEVKNRTKVFLDMVVDRLAGGLAGLLLVFCTSVLLLSVRQIGIVIVLFAAVWIGLGGFALRAYVHTIRKSLEKREVHLESVTVNVSDAATIGVLTQALDSPNDRQVRYALGLLEQVPQVSLTDRLAGLLRNRSAEVRAATLRLLTARGDRSAIQAAEEFVISGEPELRFEAVHYICQSDPKPNVRLHDFLNHPDLDVRLAALITVEKHTYQRPLPAISHQWIEDLMSRCDAETEKSCTLAARGLVLADPQVVPVTGYLRRLLGDSNPAIVNAALRTAGKVQSRELIPLIANKLAKRTMRAEAREALARYGSRIVGTLGDYLGDPNEKEGVQRAIPRVLGQIATTEAAEILVRHLPDSSLEMRFQILKALNRIRRDHPQVPIPGDIIDNEVLREAKHYYQLLFSVRSDRAPAEPGRKLLIRTLEERLDQTLERIFRLLGLHYPPEEIYDAYRAVKSSQSQRRSGALEFLDSTLERSLKRTILPLLEESSWDRLRPLGKELFGLETLSTEQSLRELIRGDDQWVKMVALYRAAELQLKSLEAEMRIAENDLDPLVVETARLALTRMNPKPS